MNGWFIPEWGRSVSGLAVSLTLTTASKRLSRYGIQSFASPQRRRQMRTLQPWYTTLGRCSSLAISSRLGCAAARLSPNQDGFRLTIAPSRFALPPWADAWTIEDADEVLALANEQGFAYWGAFGAVMRGWCLSTRGQGAEGVPLMLQGLGARRATLNACYL
jgi:hypothetical protein